MTDFPETRPVAQGAWATDIPGRRPAFKAHTNSAHAKNALSVHWRQYSKVYGEPKPPGGRFTQDMAVYELAMKGEGVIWKLKTKVTEGSSRLDYPELWPNG